MKRGTNPTLKVLIGMDTETLSSVDFVFKQECSEACTTAVRKTWPSEDVTTAEDGSFIVSFTEEETRTFAPDSCFYMDTRPVLANGRIIPTNIVSLHMDATLFEEEEDDDD